MASKVDRVLEEALAQPVDDRASKANDRPIIKTSSVGWFEELAKAYKERRPFALVDDAGIGIDLSTPLSQIGKRAHLSTREWVAVLVALGMAGAGAFLVGLAFVDPEPTSKLGLLVGGGVVCLLGGGFSAIQILTDRKPPKIRVDKAGVFVDWS